MRATGKSLVLGASDNPDRYSYLAVRKLTQQSYPVVALGLKTGEVAGVPIQTGRPELTDVDTVTLYLNPKNQEEYYDYILSLRPRRIIFNPGTENEEFAEKARQQGAEAIIACTLVMLGTGQY